jgi:hypothetical protein
MDQVKYEKCGLLYLVTYGPTKLLNSTQYIFKARAPGKGTKTCNTNSNYAVWEQDE